MITTRSGKANNGLMQIEELRLKNKAINDKKREDEAATQRTKDNKEASKKAATITPRNLLDLMNSDQTQITPDVEAKEDDREVAALMELETNEKQHEEADTSEMSPVKKRSKGKRSNSSRPRSTATDPPPTGSINNSVLAKSATFLDEAIYHHSCVIIELAILLKSDKGIYY